MNDISEGDQTKKSTLSDQYLMFGIGGLIGGISCSLSVLLFGFPVALLACALVQFALGAYLVLCYSRRSATVPNLRKFLVILVCFLVNGGVGFAIVLPMMQAN